MSIVVAVKKGAELVIAADTQQNFGSSKPCAGNVRHSKIVKIDGAYLGLTGWGIYENILADYLSDKQPVDLQTRQTVFTFFRELWPALHQRYSLVNDQSQERDHPFGDLDSAFLVATKANIFYVSANMSVSEFHRFHAIGSGCDFAIGAMHALYEQNLTAAAIAQKAIHAAICHDVYCGGEIELIAV